jgi:hypothetical protein
MSTFVGTTDVFHQFCFLGAFGWTLLLRTNGTDSTQTYLLRVHRDKDLSKMNIHT